MAAGDEAALTAMAVAAGTDLAGYQAQLASTQMFYTPEEAVAFTESPDLIQTMDLVRQFSFAHGLLGPGAPSPDVVGIAFPNGEILGDAGNVNLRFTPAFTQLAAEGGL